MASQTRFDFGRGCRLFNQKTIARALTRFRLDASETQRAAAKRWAAQLRHVNFRKAKETTGQGCAASRRRSKRPEREIDRIVYTLFDLTAEEIALLEGSLAGRN
jgi:hypothetical protein